MPEVVVYPAAEHLGMTLGVQWPGVNDHSPVFTEYRAKCSCGWTSEWNPHPVHIAMLWTEHAGWEELNN